MIRVIIAGHGNFATGIQSSLHLIAGKQEEIRAVDFTAGMGHEEIKNKLKEAVEGAQEVLILCDLLGGTPFKVSSELIAEMPEVKMNVVSGLNLCMLTEAAFTRLSQSLDELVKTLKVSGQNGIIDTLSLMEDDVSEEVESGF